MYTHHLTIGPGAGGTVLTASRGRRRPLRRVPDLGGDLGKDLPVLSAQLVFWFSAAFSESKVGRSSRRPADAGSGLGRQEAGGARVAKHGKLGFLGTHPGERTLNVTRPKLWGAVRRASFGSLPLASLSATSLAQSSQHLTQHLLEREWLWRMSRRNAMNIYSYEAGSR